MQNNDGEGWIGTKEAAEHLGYAPRTLYNKISRGENIPHEKLAGGSLRFRKSDLDRWVTDRTVSTERGQAA